MDRFLGYQIGFIITALWWFVLTIPMYKNVTQRHGVAPEPAVIRNSFGRIAKTFRQIRQFKVVFVFLIAYFLYIDGVDTIIKMVVPYSQEVLGGGALDMFVLLGILLVIQIIAFPCALLYGYLAKRFGAKRMIQVGIFTYIIAVIFAYFISSIGHIFVLGALVGSAQGGIQACLVRTMRRLFPKRTPTNSSASTIFSGSSPPFSAPSS